MFVVFRGHETNVFTDPAESLMGMFMMALGEFSDTYESFETIPNDIVPKVQPGETGRDRTWC